LSEKALLLYYTESWRHNPTACKNISVTSTYPAKNQQKTFYRNFYVTDTLGDHTIMKQPPFFYVVTYTLLYTFFHFILPLFSWSPQWSYVQTT